MTFIRYQILLMCFSSLYFTQIGRLKLKYYHRAIFLVLFSVCIIAAANVILRNTKTINIFFMSSWTKSGIPNTWPTNNFSLTRDGSVNINSMNCPNEKVILWKKNFINFTCKSNLFLDLVFSFSSAEVISYFFKWDNTLHLGFALYFW